MKVLIKENMEIRELQIIDPETNVNWIADFTNVGSNEDFEYNEDENMYIADQDTFDWWENVTEAYQKVNNRIHDLKEVHGSDAVYEAIGEAANCDLEDQPEAINAALDEAFGE